MNIAEILKDAPKGTKLYSPICGECEIENIGTFYIVVKVPEEDKEYAFFHDGKYYNNLKGECLLFPSKENRDWSTFKVTPEFKKGDFVYLKELNGVQSISLYEGTRKNKLYSFATLFLDTGNLYYDIGPWGNLTNIKIQRLATEEEKQKLFKALDENGYIWDEEKQKLRRKTIIVTDIKTIEHPMVSTQSLNDPFSIKKEHQFKPFDKVIVRGFNNVWKCAIFSHHNAGNYITTDSTYKECIPYEGNEHLLGTTNDPE